MTGTRGRRTLLLGLASSVVWTAAGIGLGRWSGLERGRLFWLDGLFAARQRPGAGPCPHPDVVIVGIDRATTRELRRRIGRNVEDRWVVRHALGRLLVRLSRAGARTVGIDYFLTRPVDPDVDGFLLDALAGGGRAGTDGIDAVLGCAITSTESRRAIAAFREVAPDEGNTILLPDPDGIYRRVRPGAVFLDGRVPIFAFQVCRLFADDRHPDGRALGSPWLWHVGAGEDGSVELPGRFRVPAEMLIDFVGPTGTFEMLGRQFSAIDVIDGKVPAEALRGKLVLIGPAASGRDRFSVSVSPASGTAAYRAFVASRGGLPEGLDDLPEGWRAEVLRAGSMSGVEIHANVVSQILQGRYLREVSRERPWLPAVLIAAVVLPLGWTFWRDPARGKRRVVWGLVGAAVLLAAVPAAAAAGSAAAFIRAGWVFVPLGLIVAWTGQAACGIAWSVAALRRQGRRIEAMFGSAVGEELLAYIHAHPEVMTVSRRRTATVLFADIRGFTALAEADDGEAVVALLRRHFEALWRPLAEEGAWVDKYVGDLVMAAWNVLRPVDDHALRAVRAAVKMKIARAELNRRRAERGEPPVDIGIGVHTGEVVAGNIGSRRRSNFTLIGDTVNLASRIEHEAAGGEVLISAATRRRVADRVVARPRQPVSIRGKRGQYTLHEVLGLVGGPAVPGREADVERAPAEGTPE